MAVRATAEVTPAAMAMLGVEILPGWIVGKVEEYDRGPVRLTATRMDGVEGEGEGENLSEAIKALTSALTSPEPPLDGRAATAPISAVGHPPHYGGADDPYEAIKVIEAWGLGFCLGNTVKYISRAGKKGDRLEDLQKARWYLEREIKREEGCRGA